MNKNELIQAVVERSGSVSKADAARVVEGVFEVITETLTRHGDVRLVGFGTFAVSQRAASKGRNPRTGEPIQIPASKQPKFRAGRSLKEAVNR